MKKLSNEYSYFPITDSEIPMIDKVQEHAPLLYYPTDPLDGKLGDELYDFLFVGEIQEVYGVSARTIKVQLYDSWVERIDKCILSRTFVGVKLCVNTISDLGYDSPNGKGKEELVAAKLFIENGNDESTCETVERPVSKIAIWLPVRSNISGNKFVEIINNHISNNCSDCQVTLPLVESELSLYDITTIRPDRLIGRVTEFSLVVDGAIKCKLVTTQYGTDFITKANQLPVTNLEYESQFYLSPRMVIESGVNSPGNYRFICFDLMNTWETE